ncbi:MAG: hypothetical protein GYB66_04820 [Chloroflexi bacterium]|nr:hypothetical protein [Chloroflexota bacterium]
MPVPYCHICDSRSEEKQRYGDSGLAEGDYCPICYRPTCQYHLATVRFRWRADRRVDSTQVCIDCKRTYAHRNWDVANREWIS